MVAVVYVVYEKCLFKRGPNYQLHLFTDIWTGFGEAVLLKYR